MPMNKHQIEKISPKTMAKKSPDIPLAWKKSAWNAVLVADFFTEAFELLSERWWVREATYFFTES